MESYFITTANNERYQCLLPDMMERERNDDEVYKGSNPIEILSMLFRQNTCSYRVGLFIKEQYEFNKILIFIITNNLF